MLDLYSNVNGTVVTMSRKRSRSHCEDLIVSPTSHIQSLSTVSKLFLLNFRLEGGGSHPHGFISADSP
ncbi:hypothetical protein NQ315_014162 [Exocentrus adspersus]|uniref:Uncharacterized protein n=1 Tax=Exocentrus adspersus TaxID=1586481 RepID=A0AAV8VWN0_9CUCU|nr:hypothetical protein NQ315_014162 [Exocentrus adspersus]